MPSKPVPKPPDALIRTTRGRYESGDGRFVVEQASGRWMVVDAASTDELGLPLVRGPFATLADARTATAAARKSPAPTSELAARLAAYPPRRRTASARPGARHRAPTARPSAPPPTIELRDYRPGDGVALRALWGSVGLQSLGDDDPSLDRFAARNAGLLIVATEGATVVGSALGAWDGRRGWIYHVASDRVHRRAGVATRLVRRLEGRLRELGCPKVNVIVRDDNEEGRRFWEALGYQAAPARQLGKEL